ncbi:hypothetical protein CC117_06035 [Parafrankia colletiae]|uniref:Uncharacterized protein n=1 Tax=Parafrankia colletiae TaxID=573497 RepID=A0A1S1QBB0_9ACTN|nr:hypothetical protein CC117_06035 [Parafrankia colletiae]
MAAGAVAEPGPGPCLGRLRPDRRHHHRLVGTHTAVTAGVGVLPRPGRIALVSGRPVPVAAAETLGGQVTGSRPVGVAAPLPGPTARLGPARRRPAVTIATAPVGPAARRAPVGGVGPARLAERVGSATPTATGAPVLTWMAIGGMAIGGMAIGARAPAGAITAAGLAPAAGVAAAGVVEVLLPVRVRREWCCAPAAARRTPTRRQHLGVEGSAGCVRPICLDLTTATRPGERTRPVAVPLIRRHGIHPRARCHSGPVRGTDQVVH